MSECSITEIQPTKFDLRPEVELCPKKRVAAYARVSTEQDEQQNSYEAQVKYYTQYIKANPAWTFVGVYADEGITGTSTKQRDGFNRMIADAKAGKIDMILTKSISRFARNTVDTLNTVRELKLLGIEVVFEKENIRTLDKQSEMLLTIMSSLAQEESRSISENVQWGHRRSMQNGKPQIAYGSFLGYRRGADGNPEIDPSEAKIVQDIYSQFLDGASIREIAKRLTEKGIPTPRGKEVWRTSTVRSILSNEKYKGDCLRQKTYTVDYLTKTVKKNEGERTQYYLKDSHPAIIDKDTFELVQEELVKRSDGESNTERSPFCGRIYCKCCGAKYRRRSFKPGKKNQKTFWHCGKRYTEKGACPAPSVYEEELEKLYDETIRDLVANKEAYLAECKAELKDAERLNKVRKAREKAEQDVEDRLKDINDIVLENSRVAQDQAEYERRYNALVEKAEKQKREAYKIAEEERIITAQKERVDRFICMLESLDYDSRYSPRVHNRILEKIYVDEDGNIEMHLKNGKVIHAKKK